MAKDAKDGDQLGKIREESAKVTKEVKEKTISFIIAAFGIVAGLAWNEAIKLLIEIVFPETQNTLIAKFSYAIIVTLILVIITMSISRILKSNNK